MSRAATVPPTKKLIILRGATDFPGPREQLDRPIPRFQATSSFDLANDPSLMIHPYCTACLRVVSIPPIVREHLCPLTTVTYEGYFLPSFSLPPDSSYHLFLSLSLICIDRGLDAFPKFQYSLSPAALLSTSSRKCNIDWLHRFGNSSPTAAPPIFLLPRKTGKRRE